jgi:hypothetical protein
MAPLGGGGGEAGGGVGVGGLGGAASGALARPRIQAASTGKGGRMSERQPPSSAQSATTTGTRRENLTDRTMKGPTPTPVSGLRLSTRFNSLRDRYPNIARVNDPDRGFARVEVAAETTEKGTSGRT